MNYTFKIGDTVILGRHINDDAFVVPEMVEFVGKEAILTKRFGSYAWNVKMKNSSLNIWYWYDNVMTLVSCPCRVKSCVKHR